MLRMVAALTLACLSIQQEDEGFEPLFNGKDFTGWKADDEAKKHWTIKGDTICYDGKGTHLWTAKEYGDFELKVSWRLTRPPVEMERPIILPDGAEEKDDDGKPITRKVKDAGDSGIYLRGEEKSQVNIWCWPCGSGEIWGYRTDGKMPAAVRAACTPKLRADHAPGEWNFFWIKMKGDRLTVDLNGDIVIRNAQLPGIKAAGAIALQNHGDPIEFRELKIKLPAAK